MLILDAFLHGLHERGARIELIHLTDLTIDPCQGHFECWFKTPGECTLQDDMSKVLNRLREAELWVFATGVYWDGPTGLLKTAMDRMLPFVEPFMDVDNGRTRNRLRDGMIAGKLVLVSTCGHWEMESFRVQVAQIEAFSQQVGRSFAGALLRPHAFALPHLMWLGKETAHVLEAAQKLGGQLATEGVMAEELLQTVSSELMPQAVYVRHMNSEFRKHVSAAAEGRRRAVEDSLEVEVVPHPFGFKSSDDAELNSKILAVVQRMGGTGPHAEEEYQQSLQALRTVAKEAIPVIADEYVALPETRYLDRWSLVHLLGELQDPSALPTLDEIIDSPIPAERSKVLHEYSTRADELMLRTTAVEGIKRIAEKDSKRARDLLLKKARHAQLSIRRAAVQSYLEVGGPDAAEKLLEILPEEDRWLLEIQRQDVREVPQPVIFDSTSPRKEEEPLPPRAGEIPPKQKQPSTDSPTPRRPSGTPSSKSDDKPFRG